MVPAKPMGIAPPERPARKPSASRGLYLLVHFAAFALDAAFAARFVIAPIDYCLASREAIDYVDVSFVYVQLAASLVAAACGFVAFSLAHLPSSCFTLALET